MQKQRSRYKTYPTKPPHPPLPPICIERTAGFVWRLRLMSCMELHRPPWASSNSHISLNMWELRAEARQTALTAPALFWQLCIMKTGKVEPSAVWWCITLCFYTRTNCLIAEAMQRNCSAGFKDHWTHSADMFEADINYDEKKSCCIN